MSVQFTVPDNDQNVVDETKDVELELGSVSDLKQQDSFFLPKKITGQQSSKNVINYMGASSFEWYNVKLTYTNYHKGKKEDVEMLKGCSAKLETGDLVAMMGPSGAGKSTLLDIIAYRKTTGKISGTVLLDNQTISPKDFKTLTAYVTQEDLYHPTTTIKEAVMFQAQLRLKTNKTLKAKEQMADRMIKAVGLAGKENSRIGGPLPGGISLRGLSGGEKRRLSLCCGMVTLPKVLFCDEVTSGLDGYAALVVIRLLRKFCDEGMIVVCTIHQPRGAIWEMFDKVMLLAKGYQMFFGGTTEAENWFVRDLGYVMPPATAPTDFMLDVMNIDFASGKDGSAFTKNKMTSREELRIASEKFLASDVYRFHVAPKDLTQVTAYHKDKDVPLVQWGYDRCHNWTHKFNILLGRNIRNYIRNPANVLGRSTLVCLLALLMGAIFYQVGEIQNKMTPPPFMVLQPIFIMLGTVFMVLFNMFVLPFTSLSLFIYDRQFFSKESASNMYSTTCYYLASMVCETLLHTVNAILFTGIGVTLMKYTSYLPHDAQWTVFMRYVGIMIVTNNVASIILQFCALVAPTQDLAFVMGVGYTGLQMFTAGLMIPFPMMNKYTKWINNISAMRYAMNAMTTNMFQHTNTKWLIDSVFQYNMPDTIWEDLLILGGFYAIFFFGGLLALLFLHKEQR